MNINNSQYSINNLIDYFAYFAANDKFINSFGFGPNWNVAINTNPTYPLLWVEPQPSVIGKTNIKLKLSIYLIDLVNKDDSNRNDVLSDTFQSLIDLKAFINKDFSMWLLTDDDADIEPVYEKFDDETDGWKMDLVLNFDNISDVCTIPSIYPSGTSFQSSSSFSVNLANYLPLTGGILTGPLSGTCAYFQCISGNTISATTIYLSGVSLTDTFLSINAAISSATTFVQNGINTFTGGTVLFPTVNITGGTFNSLTVTGNTMLCGGNTYIGNINPCSGNTSVTYNGNSNFTGAILSGGTNLLQIFGSQITASNGLTKTGNNIEWGGALTAATLINGFQTLDFSNLTYFNSQNGNIAQTSFGWLYNDPMYAGFGWFDNNNDALESFTDTGSINLHALYQGNSTYFSLYVPPATITNNGSNNVFIINDSISSKGLCYAGDYSNNFTPESLITKRYVSGATSGFTTGTTLTNKQIAFGSTANTITSDSNLNWDNTNKRLGIGIASPSYQLHVTRSTTGAAGYFANNSDNLGGDGPIIAYDGYASIGLGYFSPVTVNTRMYIDAAGTHLNTTNNPGIQALYLTSSIVQVDNAQYINGYQYNLSIVGNSTTAQTVNWSSANNFDYSITGNTIFTLSNTRNGQTVVVTVSNNSATSGLTSTFTAGTTTIKWQQQLTPTQTPTTGRTDVYTFVQSNNIIYGVYSQGF